MFFLLASLLVAANAFVPSSPAARHVRHAAVSSVDVSQPSPRLPALRMVVEAGAPAAAQEEEAMSLPDCPRTIWKADHVDLSAMPPVPDVTTPLRVDATPGSNAQGVGYFKMNKEQIMADLQKHGAIWFTGFDAMRDADGFRAFYEALELDPCLDPIHTSGLRKMTSKKDAVYEAVNKQSLAQHYVGMHNEATFKKAATYGAFVCFKPAKAGGEFLIADGRRIIQQLDKDVLRRIVERKVRISVSNLDLDFLGALGGAKDAAMSTVQSIVAKAVAPKFDMDLEMVYGADGKPYRLQAVESAQPPINAHPKTGQPVWFCNIHNHARYLRDNRPCTVPEVGMTEVYYGDLAQISPQDLDHINQVTMDNIVEVPMKEGDVVLLDNYAVLHGRNVFDASEGRNHAVTWFGEQSEQDKQMQQMQQKPGNMLNELINKYLVEAF